MLVGLANKGALAPEWAASFTLAALGVVVVARVSGGGARRLARGWLGRALPVVNLLLFAIVRAGGDLPSGGAMMAYLSLLVAAVTWIYPATLHMVWPGRAPGWGDVAGVLSALVWVFGLTWSGAISVAATVGGIVATAVLRAVGRGLGGRVGQFVRLGFHVGLPIATVLTLAILAGGGSLSDASVVLAGLATLLAVVGGLYVMLTGAKRRGTW